MTHLLFQLFHFRFHLPFSGLNTGEVTDAPPQLHVLFSQALQLQLKFTSFGDFDGLVLWVEHEFKRLGTRNKRVRTTAASSNGYGSGASARTL